jgi:hypothetical protein
MLLGERATGEQIFYKKGVILDHNFSKIPKPLTLLINFRL